MRGLLICAGLMLLTSCAHNSRVAVAPSLPPAMERQIRNAVDAGDGDYEVRALRERVIADPANLAVRLELGKLYQKRGYPELALDHFRLAADRFPASAEATLLAAQALNQSARSADAAGVLEAFLKTYPQSTPALYSWMGIFRDDAGDWKDGEQAHREALAKAAESKADRDYLHNNLGYALLMQGQKTEAAEEFRAALKLNPRSGIARDNLGVALADNPGEALLNWQSINEPATAHSNLAAVLIEQGKYAEARHELEIALQYNKSNSAAIANLKLVSDVDGKPVTLPAQSAATHWSRMRSSWHRWFSGSATVSPAAQPSIQTASQSPESKP